MAYYATALYNREANRSLLVAQEAARLGASAAYNKHIVDDNNDTNTTNDSNRNSNASHSNDNNKHDNDNKLLITHLKY